jgi:hypothetical protein
LDSFPELQKKKSQNANTVTGPASAKQRERASYCGTMTTPNGSFDNNDLVVFETGRLFFGEKNS